MIAYSKQQRVSSDTSKVITGDRDFDASFFIIKLSNMCIIYWCNFARSFTERYSMDYRGRVTEENVSGSGTVNCVWFLHLRHSLRSPPIGWLGETQHFTFQCILQRVVAFAYHSVWLISESNFNPELIASSVGRNNAHCGY